MAIGVYIRVSSPKGQKTDRQRAELEAWLKRHRHKDARWFEDRDSATNLRREAFLKLQAAIFSGEITVVVVWKLDRLARNLREGVNVLADWCQRGVRVIAITQQIDLSGPVGNLIAGLLEFNRRQELCAPAEEPIRATEFGNSQPSALRRPQRGRADLHGGLLRGESQFSGC